MPFRIKSLTDLTLLFFMYFHLFLSFLRFNSWIGHGKLQLPHSKSRVVVWYKLLKSLNNQHDGTPKMSMKVFFQHCQYCFSQNAHKVLRKFEMKFRIYNLHIINLKKSKNTVAFSKEIVLGIRKYLLRSEFLDVFKGNICRWRRLLSCVMDLYNQSDRKRKMAKSWVQIKKKKLQQQELSR